MRYNHKMTERREAKGKFQPRLFLTLEILSLLGIVGLIALYTRMPILVFISAIAAFYFIIISSIPRYRKVLQRQKDTHND